MRRIAETAVKRLIAVIGNTAAIWLYAAMIAPHGSRQRVSELLASQSLLLVLN